MFSVVVAIFCGALGIRAAGPKGPASVSSGHKDVRSALVRTSKAQIRSETSPPFILFSVIRPPPCVSQFISGE